MPPIVSQQPPTISMPPLTTAPTIPIVAPGMIDSIRSPDRQESENGINYRTPQQQNKRAELRRQEYEEKNRQSSNQSPGIVPGRRGQSSLNDIIGARSPDQIPGIVTSPGIVPGRGDQPSLGVAEITALTNTLEISSKALTTLSLGSIGAQSSNRPTSQAFDFTSFMNTFQDKFKTGLEKVLKSLSPQSSGVSDSSGGSVSSIDNFVSRLDKIAQTLASLSIPPEIKITGKHDINVIINGDTVLNQLKPELASIVASSIQKAFQDFRDKNPAYADTLNFDVNTANYYRD